RHPGLRVAEPDGLAGERLQVGDEALHIRPAELPAPALPQRRLACGADRVEAHLDGALVDLPLLLEDLELDLDVVEARRLERARQLPIVEPRQRAHGGMSLPFRRNAAGELRPE